jgi:hypothetical protein
MYRTAAPDRAVVFLRVHEFIQSGETNKNGEIAEGIC